jgi:hypothetical protein
MKVIDDTTQEEVKLERPDRAVSDLPAWGMNSKQTDVGDPLAGELPPLILHQGRDHVTGTGYGPPQTQGMRDGGPIELGYQIYANMRKSAAGDPPGSIAGVNGALTTVPAPPPESSVFHPDGMAKDRYANNYYDLRGPQPQMENTFTWKTTNALRNFALNNPALLAGPLPGALAGAATLGLAGLGGSWLWNKIYRPRKKDELKSRNWGLGGLALGAGLGALAGHLTSRNHPHGANYQEKVSYSIFDRQTDHVGALLAELSRVSVPPNLRQIIADRIRALSQPEAQRLLAAIGGMSGFAAGAFLAKHFRLAALPALGLSLAGGFLGANLLGSRAPQRGHAVKDFYGKAF